MRRTLLSILLLLILPILAPACVNADGEGNGNGRRQPADPSRTFRVTIENLDAALASFGIFRVPVGAASAGPALPGQAFEFSFRAAPGERLSFTTMYGQSNDLFFAPGPEGIALFDAGGNPVTGDVSSQVRLWDAGTEVNETPGAGPNQAPRQAGPDTGPDEGAPVRAIEDVNDGFTWFTDVVVTLAHDGDEFTLRIENPAGSPTPLSPGVWIVHVEPGPFFTPGLDEPRPGLEAQAEDGNPNELAGAVGLPFGLREVVLFNTPVGAAGPGPALPGQAFEVEFAAKPGDRLSFATMYGQSNDLFFGLDDTGLDLFDAGGTPRTGDISSEVILWDAGTEVNETPQAGPNQAPRQAGPNTGPDENGPVRPVSETGDGFTWFEGIVVTLSHDGDHFTLRIENPATSPTPLAPGVVVVHVTDGPLFVHGVKDRGKGLEAAAEDGAVTNLYEDLANLRGLGQAGIYNTPEGSASAGPALPGQEFRIAFDASPGDHISFASMYGQSNDLFFGPGPEGIALFDAGGNPITGDVSSQVRLWDAGTEVNEMPGAGPNQAPRQSGPDTGPAEDAPVRAIEDVGDGFTWFTGLEAELKHDGERFELVIRNPAGSPTPIAPGVYAVHREPGPFFTQDLENRKEGLEALAEDGNPAGLASRVVGELSAMARRNAFGTPLSPGVWAVHASGMPLFTDSAVDYGEGLERIAESGDPTMLSGNVDLRPEVSASGVFRIPDGAAAAGPAVPGASYTFDVDAEPGDRLSFASMFGQSNDAFFAPGDEGIALFDAGGSAVSGDVTGDVRVWDAGTEVNERTGSGANQAPRQSDADAGRMESLPVRPIRERADGFVWPRAARLIRVTIAPQ